VEDLEKRHCKQDQLWQAHNFAKKRNLTIETQNADLTHNKILKKTQRFLREVLANGLRYLRWGGDGEAVQLEKC
jgi:hypothetical protein